ncbi:Glycine receptor subunit beta-type 4 [Toxocara canis]|uniref:Glycine receptor subunit beta-type 4 n=1 Tax=Toxocara canis TaxID=6265 RepID=A0A0B2W135_TOXCA|nr:Glycine receptor subunit beta-type 4 [Toxocara canis]
MISLQISLFVLLTSVTVVLGWLSISEIVSRKSKPPPLRGRQPLSVNLGMYLESIGNFRETQMSFDVDLYMYMSWRDPFLAHNESDYIMINDNSIRQQIWLPDLYFANARNAHFHEVTVPNFNLFIAPDGTVAYSCRVTLTVACNLDLIHYPMDHQKCFIRILSYAYIASEVNVTWFQESPVRYNAEIELPEFVITEVSGGYCNGTYRYAVTANSYKVDKFSCLECKIHLGRSIGYNLVQSFIPTGLIVVISWVSFWIDRRAVPARVTLSFTTMVSLTTIGNGLRFGLPQVSYAKAIDFWFGACMLFVFCALLEFAVVNSYMRQSEKYDRLAKRFATAGPDSGGSSDVVEPLPPTLKCTEKSKRKPERRDYQNNGSLKEDANDKNENYFNQPLRNRLDSCNAVQHLIPQSRDLITSTYDNVSVERVMDVDLETNVKETNELNKQHKDDHMADQLSRGSRTQSTSPPPQRTAATGRRRGYITGKFIALAVEYSHRAHMIDKTCRYMFPVLFLLWNLLYWCYYLMLQKAIV